MDCKYNQNVTTNHFSKRRPFCTIILNPKTCVGPRNPLTHGVLFFGNEPRTRAKGFPGRPFPTTVKTRVSDDRRCNWCNVGRRSLLEMIAESERRPSDNLVAFSYSITKGIRTSYFLRSTSFFYLVLQKSIFNEHFFFHKIKW